MQNPKEIDPSHFCTNVWDGFQGFYVAHKELCPSHVSDELCEKDSNSFVFYTLNNIEKVIALNQRPPPVWGPHPICGSHGATSDTNSLNFLICNGASLGKIQSSVAYTSQLWIQSAGTSMLMSNSCISSRLSK